MPIYIRQGPEKPTEEHWTYWKSLGRFVHFYALLEREAFTLFLEKAELPRPIAQALHSGLRLEAGMSLIKRVCEVNSEIVPGAVSRAMTQLSHINAARNKIIHHGATLHDGAFVVTDRHKTIPTSVYEETFPPAVIDQMTEDLETIGAAFYVWLIGPSAEGWDIAGVNWNNRANAPWRYTPSSQARKLAQPRDKDRSP